MVSGVRRTWLIAAFALTAVALTALVMLSHAGVSEAQTDARSSSPDVRGEFDVLRRAPRPGDVLPPAVRRMFEPTAAREGLNLDAARAAMPGGRGNVWVLPGKDSVCLAIPDPVDGFGISCRAAADAAAGQLWVGLVGVPGQQAGDALVAVLVPDGTDTVTAVERSGTRRALQVSGNVAFADVTDAHHLELADGADEHSLATPGTPEALVAGR
jgi:hypothetical protein